MWILLIVAVILSTCLGAVKISLPEFYSIISNRMGINQPIIYQPQQEAVLFSIRLPRVVLGVLVGAALAVSGAAMQGLFRNPLAEPGLIGISSGASLFAVLMIVLGKQVFGPFIAHFGYYALSMAAFLGACITTMLVYRLSVYRGKAVITTLLLTGIAINALSGAFTGLLTYVATDEELRNITFWNLGSLGGASWSTVKALLPFVIIPLVALPFLAKSLNALALGESQAAHMGVRVDLVKRIIIVLATMAVGACVATCGIIGFIGLIIPHIIRMAGGASHQNVISGSAVLGAVVLTSADFAFQNNCGSCRIAHRYFNRFNRCSGIHFYHFQREKSKNLMISVKQLSYRIGQKHLLRDINFDVKAGEMLAVIGANGAGKSTLMKLLCRDIHPTQGEISLKEQPIKSYKITELARIRAVLAQQNTISMAFTVHELVSMGRYPHIDGQPTAHDQDIVKAVMAETGISH